MWSSILMTVLICGAPPADTGSQHARNVERQFVIPNEAIRYGYTPTRWRSWNQLPATIRIERQCAVAGAPRTGEAAATDSGIEPASSQPVDLGDRADSAARQPVPTSVTVVAESAPHPAPQSIPPSRFLNLEQPGTPSTDVTLTVLGKPVCRANRPAVLDAPLGQPPRLLNPTFDRLSIQ